MNYFARDDDVEVVCEPAVSVIDVACAALGVDPVAHGLRVVDALDSTEPFRGPGPLLVLQTYSPEVMSVVATDCVPSPRVSVLFHLGLADQQVVFIARERVGGIRQGRPLDVAVDRRNSRSGRGHGRSREPRRDDYERSVRGIRNKHTARLTKHLLEESYEALDALEAFAEAQRSGVLDDELIDHVQEELGDVLCQIVFHAELGDEEGLFNFATVADSLRDKLTSRHPHIFGDTEVRDAADVADRWETLKAKGKRQDERHRRHCDAAPRARAYTKAASEGAAVRSRMTSRSRRSASTRRSWPSVNFAPRPR